MNRYRNISLLSSFLLLLIATMSLTCKSEDENEGTPPDTPQNLTAEPSRGQITLNWTREDSVSYELFHSRAAGAGVQGTNVMKIVNIAPPYDHTGLTDGTTYYYYLTANNSFGASIPTAEVSETTLPPPASPSPPETPQNFTAVAGSRQVTLNWSPQPNVTYYLFHSIRAGLDVRSGTDLMGVLNVTPPYSHTGLTNKTTYYYRLTAMNSFGTSAPTAELSATPQLQISTGISTLHTCAVVGDRAMCWGEGGSGRLGHNVGDGTGDRSIPTKVHGLTTGVTQISAGSFHTCAVVNGGARCWGDGGDGQLGHNDGTANKSEPTQVEGLTTGVTQISAGANHTCAVVEGRALCWGEGDNGRLGHNEPEMVDGDGRTVAGPFVSKSEPTQVQGLTTGVTQISAGSEHTCAVVEGGRALCWGLNDSGQLGHNEPEMVDGDGVTVAGPFVSKSEPTQVQGLTTGVTQISAGANHTCAVVNGGAFCWGWGLFGQLGNGGTSNVAAPPQEEAVGGFTTGVTQISAGAAHTCAIVNGRALCWGLNAAGQLGDGGTTNTTTPQDVMGLGNGVEDISAGNTHTCAVAGGRALCWGSNSSDQLGRDMGGDSHVPVRVSRL